MRARKPVLATEEDIVSYEWYMGSNVRVTVAHGNTVGGKFVPSPGQTPAVYDITGADYDELMDVRGEKPKDTLKKDDLWADVDKLRARKVSK